MKRASLELGVGIFVFIGMLAVGYLTVKLGRMEMFQGDYYLVTARFQNVAGLKAGSSWRSPACRSAGSRRSGSIRRTLRPWSK